MRYFFPTLDCIAQFIASANATIRLVCPHCGSSQHWISHGFLRKQLSSTTTWTYGKRLLCSNRRGHAGCGRTQALRLSEALPRRHTNATALGTFLHALTLGVPVPQAYQSVQTRVQPRQGWRWQQTLKARQVWLRSLLMPANQTTFAPQGSWLDLLTSLGTHLSSPTTCLPRLLQEHTQQALLPAG